MENVAMNQNKYFFVAVTLIVAAFLLVGCNSVGWTTKPPKGLNISEGKIFTIMQNDGTLFLGENLGANSALPKNYVEKYTLQSQISYEGKYLPAIGQKIFFTTVLSDAKIWEGQFLGFDHKNLWIKMKDKSAPQSIYFTSITRFSGRSGETFRRMELRNMFVEGRIPLLSTNSRLISDEMAHVPAQ